MLKIATWNVNSIRSRLVHVQDFLKENRIDILLLQELKCENHQFPQEIFEEMGYNMAIHGQKSYNSVAILSRFSLEDIKTNFPSCPDPSQARYVEAVISLPNNDAMKLISVYVPNGMEVGSEKFLYKLDFLENFTKHLKNELSLDMKIVVGGDFNIAPTDSDIYKASGFESGLCVSPQERAHFQKMLNLGYSDAYRSKNPNKIEFTWWDYRESSWQQNKGLRIDHFLLSPEAQDQLLSCHIDMEFRSREKPSDHAPVIIELGVKE